MTHADLVAGIGGVFWRAKDPAALGAWYHEHFGIPANPQTDGAWFPGAGPTVFAPFDADTGYFGGPQAHMINFPSKTWMPSSRLWRMRATRRSRSNK